MNIMELRHGSMLLMKKPGIKERGIAMDSNTIQDQLDTLDNLLKDLNQIGMPGHSGLVWPVIIRRNSFGAPKYEYEYPYAFFDNLKYSNKIYFNYEHKKDRLPFVKLIIDKLIKSEIDIHLYHFGMYIIYNIDATSKFERDLSDNSIGKKRVEFVKTLPVAHFLNTDDFISAIWADQIKRWYTDLGEHRINPSMNKVRILFSSEQFGDWAGTYYANADWVEPISAASDLKCKTWTQEKDPMNQDNTLPEGWIEGQIILGHEGPGNYRHFVAGEPVHAGSAIQVKFGKGWIKGRYEWSFDPESLIQIHSCDEVFYINEGHSVRIRK